MQLTSWAKKIVVFTFMGAYIASNLLLALSPIQVEAAPANTQQQDLLLLQKLRAVSSRVAGNSFNADGTANALSPWDYSENQWNQVLSITKEIASKKQELIDNTIDTSNESTKKKGIASIEAIVEDSGKIAKLIPQIIANKKRAQELIDAGACGGIWGNTEYSERFSATTGTAATFCRVSSDSPDSGGWSWDNKVALPETQYSELMSSINGKLENIDGGWFQGQAIKPCVDKKVCGDFFAIVVPEGGDSMDPGAIYNNSTHSAEDSRNTKDPCYIKSSSILDSWWSPYYNTKIAILGGVCSMVYLGHQLIMSILYSAATILQTQTGAVIPNSATRIGCTAKAKEGDAASCDIAPPKGDEDADQYLFGRFDIGDLVNPIQDIVVSNQSFGEVVQRAYNGVLRAVNVVLIAALLFLALINIFQVQVNTYGISKILPTLLLGFLLAQGSMFAIRASLEVTDKITGGILSLGVKDTDEKTRNDFSGFITAFSSFPFTLDQIAGGNTGANNTATTKNSADGTAVPKTPADTASPTVAATTASTCNSKSEGWLTTSCLTGNDKENNSFDFGKIIKLMIHDIFTLIGAVMLLVLGLQFVLRRFVFFFLIPLAPLAAMAFGFPPAQTLWSKWWKTFSGWLFMPIAAIFWVWLALVWFSVANPLINDPQGGGTVSGIVSYAFGIVALYLAVKTPSTMVGEVKVAGKMMEGFTKNLIDRPAQGIASSAARNTKNALLSYTPAGSIGRAYKNYAEGKKIREDMIMQGPVLKGLGGRLAKSELGERINARSKGMVTNADQAKRTQEGWEKRASALSQNNDNYKNREAGLLSHQENTDELDKKIKSNIRNLKATEKSSSKNQQEYQKYKAEATEAETDALIVEAQRSSGDRNKRAMARQEDAKVFKDQEEKKYMAEVDSMRSESGGLTDTIGRIVKDSDGNQININKSKSALLRAEAKKEESQLARDKIANIQTQGSEAELEKQKELATLEKDKHTQNVNIIKSNSDSTAWVQAKEGLIRAETRNEKSQLIRDKAANSANRDAEAELENQKELSGLEKEKYTQNVNTAKSDLGRDDWVKAQTSTEEAKAKASIATTNRKMFYAEKVKGNDELLNLQLQAGLIEGAPEKEIEKAINKRASSGADFVAMETTLTSLAKQLKVNDGSDPASITKRTEIHEQMKQVAKDMSKLSTDTTGTDRFATLSTSIDDIGTMDMKTADIDSVIHTNINKHTQPAITELTGLTDTSQYDDPQSAEYKAANAARTRAGKNLTKKVEAYMKEERTVSQDTGFIQRDLYDPAATTDVITAMTNRDMGSLGDKEGTRLDRKSAYLGHMQSWYDGSINDGNQKEMITAYEGIKTDNSDGVDFWNKYAKAGFGKHDDGSPGTPEEAKTAYLMHQNEYLHMTKNQRSEYAKGMAENYDMYEVNQHAQLVTATTSMSGDRDELHIKDADRSERTLIKARRAREAEKTRESGYIARGRADEAEAHLQETAYNDDAAIKSGRAAAMAAIATNSEYPPEVTKIAAEEAARIRHSGADNAMAMKAAKAAAEAANGISTSTPDRQKQAAKAAADAIIDGQTHQEAVQTGLSTP